MTRWSIEPAVASEASAIAQILHDAALPTDDLGTAQPRFWVGRAQPADGNEICGVIGLETLGPLGLLRSLAVRANGRGAGLGSALVAHVESQARAAGLVRLVLLTTTAADFFAARGYRVTAREALPSSVLESSQFRTVCPASATAMIKQLEPS